MSVMVLTKKQTIFKKGIDDYYAEIAIMESDYNCSLGDIICVRVEQENKYYKILSISHLIDDEIMIKIVNCIEFKE